MPVNLEPISPRSPFESIRRAGIASWGLLGMLLLAGVLATIGYFLRAIFPPMALAMLIIFLLNPLVTALERRGVRRSFGTLGIYVLFVAFVVSAALMLASPLEKQGRALASRLPDIRTNAVEAAESLASRFNVSLDEIGLGALVSPDPEDKSETSSEKKAEKASGSGFGQSLFAGFGRFATGAFHVVLIFVLAPFVALYLLIDLPRMRSLEHYIPPRYRAEWLLILRRCGQAVGGFFRGQLLVAAIVGVLSSLAFWLLDLPFWLPIGLLAGFFNIIPLIGPFVGGAIAAIVGALFVSPSLGLKAAGAMLLIQQIDNHFISPKVMGRAVRLHPVAVMMALLLGGTLAGFWGILLAVPGVAVAKIIALHFYETRVLGNPDPELVEASEQTAPQGTRAVELRV